MAQAVGKGAEAAGKEASVVAVSDITADVLKDLPGFALGCPAMGAEELDDSEMDPFVTEVEAFIKGKTIALFGSYGWGDGEWMRTWTERMQNAGATVVDGEGVIANEAPDEEALSKCEELGKKLAAL
jgi:flavodoxin short chain